MARMALLLAAVACLASTAAAATSGDDMQYLFEAWRAQHGKTYPTAAHASFAYNTFADNVAAIEAHNARAEQGLETFTLALNQFGDMNEAQFRDFVARSGLKPKSHNNEVATKEELVAAVNGDVPDAIDWRTKGAVTPVKNQGQCGSCWAFSTTGGVEGRVAVATGKLTSLSEQQLVDCAKKEGNQGCNGGLMDDGFQYIIDNKGIDTEEDYPYTAKDGTCKTGLKAASTITGFKDVTANDEDALKAAAAAGPVSVAIDASSMFFQFYHSGVYTRSCGTSLDHGVLVVGYGTDSGTDYWWVKNSWGATWGDAGYIRLSRNVAQKGGQCGVAMQASFPTVASEQAVSTKADGNAHFFMYNAWKAEHGIVYNTIEEDARRFLQFVENLAIVEAHNAGSHSHKMGLNQFSAMSAEEFKAYRGRSGLAPVRSLRRERNALGATEFAAKLGGSVPKSIDWRSKGAVTPVKDQGQCGSCWSFSTTGGIEGAHAIATGKLVSLSEQELVDCSTKNNGCNGGMMDLAFDWVKKNGLETESKYPYKAEDGRCEKSGSPAVTISGYTDVAKNDEDALMAAVANGPVSVAVDAEDGWQMYSGGVLTAECGTSLDHGVLLVGYGSENGQDYWLVKNSWATSWGEEGYIRLARGVRQSGGQCGIAMMASQPTA